MYADDLILLCPSVKGINSLIKICLEYGDNNFITFNPKKSEGLFIRSNENTYTIPAIKVGGKKVPYKPKVKYLGHIICNNFRDDEDIKR